MANIKLWLSALLTGFGIAAPIPHFMAGLFLAVAGAYLASTWTPENDRRELLLVVTTAMLISTLLAIVYPYWTYINWAPIQLVMGLGGFFSRYIITGGMRIAEGIANNPLSTLKNFFKEGK